MEEIKIKFKINPWMVSTLLLALFSLILLVFPIKPTGRIIEAILTKEEAGRKAIEYINKNLVQDGAANVVSVEDIGGAYKVITSYKGNEIPVYILKDGSYLFLYGYNTSQTIEKIEREEEQQAPPKRERPEAHVFIMSYCPFGLQFLKAYIPVIELLGNRAELQINFVHYAMHGEKELIENTRIYCIQKDYKAKLTSYLRCFVETDNPEECMKKAGIDKDSVESCMNETDKEFGITEKFKDKSKWMNGRYPPYDVDAALANKYSVSGSPTFIINDQKVQVTRSAEAIKNAICSAFITQPEECKQKLSETVEQPGIGPIGSQGSASSGGQC